MKKCIYNIYSFRGGCLMLMYDSDDETDKFN